MQPESMIKLLESGNVSTVEEEWMQLLEVDGLSAAKLKPYESLLKTMARNGKLDQAEAMAWTAVESVEAAKDQTDALVIAGWFLVALGNDAKIRGQVADMYRQVYADIDNLDALIDEAGVVEGRPVRRAVRTLNTVIGLAAGDYLSERHEEGAARIESIDTDLWEYEITTIDGVETLGAVHLADRFRKADAENFRVMLTFDPDGLFKRMNDDPLPYLEEICRDRGNTIDSDDLEHLLQTLMNEKEYKKWWTTARSAMKKSPQFELAGRSPYVITFDDSPASLEPKLEKSYAKAYEPMKKLTLVEDYLSESKQYGQDLNQETLKTCYDDLVKLAERHALKNYDDALLCWLAASRVGEAAGVELHRAGAEQLLRESNDMDKLFGGIKDVSLVKDGLQTLVVARGDESKDMLAELLPQLPAGACDTATDLLTKAGYQKNDFQPIIDQILAEPRPSNEALLWLWDGPSTAEHLPEVPLLTVLKCVLRALNEIRLGDHVPREVSRKISQRSRTVLSARRYERFEACLADIDPGVASALFTDVNRLDNLGRSVHDELLKRLRAAMPAVKPEAIVLPWDREDVIYVTNAGMSKKQAEIEYHVNVKMKENSKRIGEAASLGDLSENSEYKFALEERDLLRARLAQMNSEMNKAQVLREEEVPTDHIGIGSHVIFERDDGQHHYEMVILSPWEADVEKGIFNYSAPMMQGILGMKVGDVIDFDHPGASGTYKVVEIDNGLTRVDD